MNIGYPIKARLAHNLRLNSASSANKEKRKKEPKRQTYACKTIRV